MWPTLVVSAHLLVVVLQTARASVVDDRPGKQLSIALTSSLRHRRKVVGPLAQLQIHPPGLYLEFSLRGCNGRAGESVERKSPSGVQGQGRSRGLEAKPPEAIGIMKYCAYKNWFMCIICLYVIAKTYTEIEKTYSYATRQDEMMDSARGVWIGVRWGGVIWSQVGVYTPLGESV